MNSLADTFEWVHYQTMRLVNASWEYLLYRGEPLDNDGVTRVMIMGCIAGLFVGVAGGAVLGRLGIPVILIAVMFLVMVALFGDEEEDEDD